MKNLAPRVYRFAMLQSFALPVGLFLLLPLVVPALASGTALPMLFLLLVIASIGAAGFVLAPWAGRAVPTRKLPSFLMSALSATAGFLPVFAVVVREGDASFVLGIFGIYELFAIPASVLGALFFVGSCEKLHKLAEKSPPEAPAH